MVALGGVDSIRRSDSVIRFVSLASVPMAKERSLLTEKQPNASSAGALVDTFTKVRSGVYDVSFRKEHKKPARIREMAFNADNNRADPKSSKHALEGSCSSQILHRYVHSSCLTLNKFERMYGAARRHGCPECAELRSAFTNLRKDVPLASSTLIEKLGTATTQVPVV